MDWNTTQQHRHQWRYYRTEESMQSRAVEDHRELGKSEVQHVYRPRGKPWNCTEAEAQSPVHSYASSLREWSQTSSGFCRLGSWKAVICPATKIKFFSLSILKYFPPPAMIPALLLFDALKIFIRVHTTFSSKFPVMIFNKYVQSSSKSSRVVLPAILAKMECLGFSPLTRLILAWNP